MEQKTKKMGRPRKLKNPEKVSIYVSGLMRTDMKNLGIKSEEVRQCIQLAIERARNAQRTMDINRQHTTVETDSQAPGSQEAGQGMEFEPDSGPPDPA